VIKEHSGSGSGGSDESIRDQDKIVKGKYREFCDQEEEKEVKQQSR
jgi:hypothetical protein